MNFPSNKNGALIPKTKCVISGHSGDSVDEECYNTNLHIQLQNSSGNLGALK